MDLIQVYVKYDLYEILDLNNQSDSSDIKNKYRKLARKFHPDKYINSDDLDEDEKKALKDHFNLINIAHDILFNDETRKIYDKARKEYLDAGQIFDLKKQFNSFENINFNYGDEGTAKKNFKQENEKINVDNEKIAEDIRLNTIKNLDKKFEIQKNDDFNDLLNGSSKNNKNELSKKFNDTFNSLKVKSNKNTEIMAYNGDDFVSNLDNAFDLMGVSDKDFVDTKKSLDERMREYKNDFDEILKKPIKKNN
jgi:curved DNA-binding protein CbpA